MNPTSPKPCLLRALSLLFGFLTLCTKLSAQINLNQGLVAYYPFTGNANDMSGNNNNPSFNNATLTTDKNGVPNNAYYFNGSSSYMRIPNSSLLNPQKISMCALVKPMGFYQGPCHGNAIVNKSNTDNYLPSMYRLRFDDNLFTHGGNCSNPVPDIAHENFYGDFGGNGAINIAYTPYVQLNNWYCLVFTYDGNTSKFYVNGTLIQSLTSNYVYQDDGSDLFFGRMNDNLFPYWFNGVIDEIRIYNRALNASEVNALCGDMSCPSLTGTLVGSNVCAGTQGTLTFNASNGVAPYTLTYSDGTTTYTAPNVQSGVAFTVANGPVGATTYSLLSIEDASSCAATPVSGISAVINVTNCSLCTGSLGDPVVNITFGSGNNPGPTLPASVPGATTTLSYIAVNGNPANPTPVDGQYTITNNTPFNNAWWAGFPDHTPNDANGYMALYNASEQPGEFYKQSIDNLCPGTTYEFAAWIANCVNPAQLNGVLPNITFRIEKTDGTLISSYNSGGVSESSVFTWKKYGFYFTLPPGIGSVVLKLVNNSPGGTAQPGNDFAIDDITFRPCGPNSAASFSPSSSVDSMQFCEGSVFNLYGSVSFGYAAPNFLWQVSSDSGRTWIDIVSSNNLTPLLIVPITGITKTYLYRMLTADGVNINSINCRISSNLVKVIANPLPQGGITGDTICIGSPASLLLNATSGTSPFVVSYSDGTNNFVKSNVQSAIAFTVQNTPSVNTTYQLLSLTDKNGCSRSAGFNPSTAAVQVNSKSLAADSIQSNQQAFCPGTNILLTVKGGTLGTSAAWKWYESSCGGTSINSGTTLSIAPSATTAYYVRGEGLCNVTSCVNVSLNVFPKPDIVFDPVPDVCEDAPAFQVMEAKEVSGLQGTGSFTGSGISTSGMFSPTNAGTGSHIIAYSFVSTYGCTDTKSRTLVVNPIPKAEAGNDILACPGMDAQLKAEGGVSYVWTPTTGLNNPTAPDPIVNITTPTMYFVKVTDAKGCSAIDSMNVYLSTNGKESFKMPNAFTPNNDGKNDCFGIHKWGNVTIREFSVFNRWGQKIFSTTNSTDCWDGTFKGTKVDAGGYVYMIDAVTGCGEIFLKGVVMLIR
jgi:gliding motility-associated-like protein